MIQAPLQPLSASLKKEWIFSCLFTQLRNIGAELYALDGSAYMMPGIIL